MRLRASLSVALAVAAVTVSVSLAPTASYAAETTVEPDAKSTYIVSSLKRVGVNHKIAKANGYEIRVDANGVEYAVKPGEVTTFDTRYGECGTSWVYFTAVDTAKHYSSIYTGHTIRTDWPGAVYTYWRVSVLDNYGSSVKSWNDPSTPTRFWAKTHPFTSSGAGWAYADVITGVVTLADGTICYSHGPEASAYL